MKNLKPETYFNLIKIIGFGLIFALWLQEGERMGFFLFWILVFTELLRHRFPKLRFTIIVDLILCITFSNVWEYAPYFMALPLFSALYYRFFWAALTFIYLFFDFNPLLAVSLSLSALCGYILGILACENKQKIELCDKLTGRCYELENLQNELAAALVQVERMTAIAERTHIARNIHDNAGHEIVAAFISLQTIRKMMDSSDAEILRLYDAALQRLINGVEKIRETAHNLQSVTRVGLESLLEKCRLFPGCPVECHVFGDTSQVPMYAWIVLYSCLNESLTNIIRHSAASHVNVTLDATPHIVRLSIKNNGVTKPFSAMGTGLRNLRHRAVVVGGSLSVDASDEFQIICVIPIKEDSDESIDC